MAPSIAFLARDHLGMILVYQALSTVVSGAVLLMLWRGGI